MSKYNVKRYSGDLKPLWNLFIASAKNATFLFDRDFMEYHADRFTDFSVLVFKADKLVAVLPRKSGWGNPIFAPGLNLWRSGTFGES